MFVKVERLRQHRKRARAVAPLDQPRTRNAAAVDRGTILNGEVVGGEGEQVIPPGRGSPLDFIKIKPPPVVILVQHHGEGEPPRADHLPEGDDLRKVIHVKIPVEIAPGGVEPAVVHQPPRVETRKEAARHTPGPSLLSPGEKPLRTRRFIPVNPGGEVNPPVRRGPGAEHHQLIPVRLGKGDPLKPGGPGHPAPPLQQMFIIVTTIETRIHRHQKISDNAPPNLSRPGRFGNPARAG